MLAMKLFNSRRTINVGRSKYFEVKVETDRDYYCVGEQVNGIVTLDVKDRCALKDFKLKFKCTEETLFHEIHPRGDTRLPNDLILNRDKYNWADKEIGNFISENLEDQVFEIGTTDYPFSFLLGDELPNSYSRTWYDEILTDDWSKLIYSLIVEVNHPLEKQR